MARQSFTWKDYDDNFSLQITLVEKEMGVEIDSTYSLMKFLITYDNLMYLKRLENGNK